MLEVSCNSESQLHLAERLRLEAARRFAYDPELDSIEQELRSDLRAVGGGYNKLSWDSCSADLAPRPEQKATQEMASAEKASADDGINSFGEDEGEEPQVIRLASKNLQLEGQDIWEVTTQVAVKLRDHHTTMTIMENAARGLMKFHGFDAESGEVVQRICSYEHFEKLCLESGDAAGNPDGAVKQLFSQPQDEEDSSRAEPTSPLLPPDQRGKKRNKDAFANFGESDGESEAAGFHKPVPVLLYEEGSRPSIHDVCQRQGGWVVLAQDALQIDGKHLTVTVSEQPEKGLLQFEGFSFAEEATEKINRLCRHEDFEQMCKSQSKSAGSGFRAAMVELLSSPQKPVDESGTTSADAAVLERRRRISTQLATFGESEEEAEEACKPKPSAVLVSSEVDTDKGLKPGWRTVSQQAFTLRGEHALLTILQNDDEQTMQFTLLRNANGEVLTKQCGVDAFDVLCNRFSDKSEPARLSAAIAEVFK
mmetsp:Transcript_69354/g.166280  ORF Transcript_69354/g.166280 Transcript_69354/m.166280 type:complete len:480 (-) Transcript_69354:137-1576(-)